MIGESTRRNASIYFPLADRDLTVQRLYSKPLSTVELWLHVAFYSLFFERLVIPDGASLFNPALRELATSPKFKRYNFRKLLEDAVIVWSQRSNAKRFVDLQGFLSSTGSWRVDESDEQRDYLEFLDDVCKSRITYDYVETAELFTQLTEACFTDSEIIRHLSVPESVVRSAIEHSESWRSKTVDQYARRTSMYEFAAKLDKRGATRQARVVRQLSSAVYHGSAANRLGLDIAYPAQYREAINALHGSGIPVWAHQLTRHPAVSPVADVSDIPFYSTALTLVTGDVIADIRQAPEFRRYIKSLAKSNKNPESHSASDDFYNALVEYISFLNIPLGTLLVGRYSEWKKLRRTAKVAKYSSRSGSGGIALLSVLEPSAGIAATALSAVWGFGGWQLTRWLEQKSQRDAATAIVATELTPDLVTIATSSVA